MKTDDNQLWNTPATRQFMQVLAAIDSVPTMQSFLRDVMTEKEIIEISARLEAAKMLTEGKKYTEITQATKLSSRTIARISDWIQNGRGGYTTALQVISHHPHLPPARAE